MSEHDVMALLAEANPVRVEDLSPLDPPNLARHRRPARRLVLVAAALAAAAAAAAAGLAGVFAGGGRTTPDQGRLGGPGAIGSNNPSWKTIPLAGASAALGAPLVLPSTDLVQPTDAGSDARTVDCSASSCAVYVSFPAQSLGISYTHPAPFPDPSAQWAADVRTAGSHHAQARLVDLNGTPGDYIDYPGVKRLVEFVAGGTWIVVSGNHDESTLQAVAQSIVDQAPKGGSSPSPIQAGAGLPEIHVGNVAEADSQLPFRVVLPSARPLVLAVALPQQNANPSLSGFFDTPATGPYEVVEQPADALGGIQALAQLRAWAKTCRSRIVCPIHRIVVVRGTHVLLIGAPGRPGGLKAMWLRGDRAGSVLTWIQGPTDYAHGDLPRHVFRPNAALAVAADMIAHGG